MAVGDLWVDYSFARPDPQKIKQAGYKGVARYLTQLPSGKALSSAEAKALHDAGLPIALVWETTAGRAAAGRDAGVADARDANKLADALGVPQSVVIFYAVDFDADPNDVAAYFRGAKAGSARPVGVYGSFRVVKAILAAGSASHAWQTTAWSHGDLLQSAHFFQRVGRTVAHPVDGTDENVVLHDFPTWNPEEPDMQLSDKVTVGDKQYTVEQILEAVVLRGRRLEADVAALKVGGVDMDALAAKVADLLAARLAK